MFFIIGVSNGRKDLDFENNNLSVCKRCGGYCRYKIYCTYICLTLFFIPVLKWSKKYYAETSCCGKIFKISNEEGRRIEKGESFELNESCFENIEYEEIKRCEMCGYTTDENFKFCPKCGKEF